MSSRELYLLKVLNTFLIHKLNINFIIIKVRKLNLVSYFIITKLP